MLTHVLWGEPKLQMQLKKGSDTEEADVFPSGSSPGSYLPAFCLPSFLRYGEGAYPRSLTVSSSETSPASEELEF